MNAKLARCAGCLRVRPPTHDEHHFVASAATALRRYVFAEDQQRCCPVLGGGDGRAGCRRPWSARRCSLCASAWGRISDRRLALNPAVDVPLPAERSEPPRFLAQNQVKRLAVEMPDPYVALVFGRRLRRVALWCGGRAHQGKRRRPSGRGSSSRRRPSRCTARSRWARSPKLGGRSGPSSVELRLSWQQQNRSPDTANYTP